MSRLGTGVTVWLIGLAVLSACSSSGNSDNPPTAPEKSGHVVASQIDFKDPDCSKRSLPVALYLTNESATPTVRLRWSFSINEKNHSTDLSGGDHLMAMADPNRTTDRIIQPGETFKVCSSAPSIGKDLSSEDLDIRVAIDEKPIT